MKHGHIETLGNAVHHLDRIIEEKQKLGKEAKGALEALDKICNESKSNV